MASSWGTVAHLGHGLVLEAVLGQYLGQNFINIGVLGQLGVEWFGLVLRHLGIFFCYRLLKQLRLKYSTYSLQGITPTYPLNNILIEILNLNVSLILFQRNYL